MDEPELIDDTSEEQQESDWDPARQVINDLDVSEGYYRDLHTLVDEEMRFVLDQEQYEFDLGHSRSQDDVQVKDLALLSTSRRKWSQIGAAPIYINPVPLDRQGDPFASERTKWALEREVYSKRRQFQMKRKRAIVGCIVGRLWYLTMEWDEDLQEIVYDTAPKSEVHKCPGFHSVHDPLCPWVVLEKTLTVSAARRLARKRGVPENEVREIVADPGTNAADTARSRGTQPGTTRLDRTSPEGTPGSALAGSVKLLIGMYREDPERAEIESTLDDPVELAPEDQFMRCWQCGYETKDHPLDATTGQLPAVGEPCPQCQTDAMGEDGQMPQSDVDESMLERVSTVEQVDRFPEFPNGRWIEVLKESRKVLYNGQWPYVKPNGQDTLRSYPMFEYYIYEDPRSDWPHSDVSWQFNMQALATYMLQWAVEQMRSSGRVIIMPKNALVDSRGRTIQYTNKLDQIAWIKDPQLAASIQEFQPRGLAQGWTELYGAISNSFRANLGTGEIGLGPGDSKDIPVGTVREIVDSGDIPVDDAIDMVREHDGQGFGVMADMIQCCWNINRWIRFLGPEGQQAFEYFSGADLVDVDVEVMGDPKFDATQAAMLSRWMEWFAMTPPQQMLTARTLNLPPSEVFQYQQAQMAFMATQPVVEEDPNAPPGKGGAQASSRRGPGQRAPQPAGAGA
jgi:hypothetical protein